MSIAARYTAILLVVSLCMAVLSNADKFETLDVNRDGFLDRSEYSILAKELRSAVDPFLIDPVVNGEKKSSFLFWEHLSAEDFVSGAFNSLVVIIVTEIGDKTFFIAAVLAMRNGRTIVYLGCMGKFLLYW